MHTSYRFLTILIGLAMSVQGLAGQLAESKAELNHQRAPMISDWSMRHMVYPSSGPTTGLLAAQKDPRARFSWNRRPPMPFSWRVPHHEPEPKNGKGFKRDWSISLGKGDTPFGMFPAKFNFDVNATPSCANDFVVFPIAVSGSATQPNLVAFNNLYSGTAGSTGLCNRTVSAKDTGVAATVFWSYDINGVGGSVTTSPALSLDGAKVAFVESAAGEPAHFHVLAWKSGDGQSAANLQNVLVPKAITTFAVTAPVEGSGTATDLALGSSLSGTDTLSSVFIDYDRDLAYVGNDVGMLYRIKDVFCTVDAACFGSNPPVPSIDQSWGASGVVTVGANSCAGTANSILTGPVYDATSNNVFVGCGDGKLYGFNFSGAALAHASVAVGDGKAKYTYGGIVDAPIVDGVSGFVYSVSGSAGGGTYGALVQAKTDLSSSVLAHVGAGNQCNIHTPQFSNAYYTSPTTAGALVYVGGVTGAVSQPCSPASSTTGDIYIYGVKFGTGGVMTAGAPANSFSAGGGPGAEWAPLTEFYNVTTSTDWLFAGAYQSAETNLGTANITSGFPAGITAVVTEGLGPSGMIVDNDSSSAQASSFYFNAMQATSTCTNSTNVNGVGGCAVKLTQAGLQ